MYRWAVEAPLWDGDGVGRRVVRRSVVPAGWKSGKAAEVEVVDVRRGDGNPCWKGRARGVDGWMQPVSWGGRRVWWLVMMTGRRLVLIGGSVASLVGRLPGSRWTRSGQAPCQNTSGAGHGCRSSNKPSTCLPTGDAFAIHHATGMAALRLDGPGNRAVGGAGSACGSVPYLSN